MKNPLWKRLPRELWEDAGKYLVIFIFMAATIGFISGFLVADSSVIAAYDESFEKYNVEDGNFETQEKMTAELQKALEKEDVTIYSNFYKEETVKSSSGKKGSSTLRIYADRTEVNKVCLMKGGMPKKSNEIGIDRMYAVNNDIEIGSKIKLANQTYKVTGYTAMPDYSALFSDNSDMMFDSIKFGTAVVTKEGFAKISDTHLHYNYAWKYAQEPSDDTQEKEWSEDFMDVLAKSTSISSFIPRYLNQAINFTREDMGGDRAMMLALLYILIVIMAFVFAVTTNHTIVKEAAVIGTLRASGYRKREILLHYISNPLIVTVLAAVVGNVLGYTVFKDLCVGMYYGSYSLTTYETRWNAEAFLLTTIVPFILMLLINLLLIAKKLQFSPLSFLRRDLSRKGRKKAMRLPHFRFFNRFRLRIIFQNMSGYITLLAGVIFANLLLLFGMMMTPLLNHHQDKIIDDMLCARQYILKAEADTKTKGAEKFVLETVKACQKGFKEEEVSVYGIGKDSEYVPLSMKDSEVYLSEGYAEKYRISEGDTITVRESYGKKKYHFKVKGIFDYAASFTIFMSKEQFAETFDKETEYFNGYFSNEKIKDIPEKMIASTITKEDLSKVSRQLKVSMGSVFYMVNVFSVVLYALLIFLLTKLIIEKNTSSISMVKILGYSNREINRLYMTATTWVVTASLVISLLVTTGIMHGIFRYIMMDYSGWFSLYIAPEIYPEMFVMGMAAYFAVALINMKKIRNIPMEEALKNVE